MPEHTRRRSHSRARIGAALTLLAAFALALVGAPAATASQGSVPAEVSAYAADPNGLVSRLDDLFGIGSGGAGIDFNETTAVVEAHGGRAEVESAPGSTVFRIILPIGEIA